jgi:STIP1 homology and U-box containing protein 1
MSSKSRHYSSPPKNAQEAEHSKHQGNLLFQKQKYAAACELYTEAILQSEQKWHVPYLNRAMANEKRLRWKEAKEDLEKCLKLDHDNVKATYHLGVCVCMLPEEIEDNYKKGAEILEKSLFLAREYDESQVDLIWRSLAKSKYMEHCEKAKERRKVYESLEAKLSHPGFVPLTEDDARVLRERVNEAKEKDERKQAPDAFCCPLSLEMYREPVVSPSGNSYERSAIEQYIKQQHEKYGREKKVADPLQPDCSITLESLHPNIALRNIVREYLREHPSSWGEILSESEAEELEREAKRMKTETTEADMM